MTTEIVDQHDPQRFHTGVDSWAAGGTCHINTHYSPIERNND